MSENRTDILLNPSSENRESRTSQLDDILIEKLESAFHKSTQEVILHDLTKIATEHSAEDLAVAAYRLPPYARTVLFKNLTGIDEKVKFIINIDQSTRIAVLREITTMETTELIAYMPPDEAVEVLEDMSDRRYRKVIESLEPDKALRIKEIEKNARNTAGRLMTNEFFAFLKDVTIGEAAACIRNNPGIDLTRRIFVVDQNSELQGYVPARNLIINASDLPLKQVMRPILQKVNSGISREEVVEVVERYQVSALPVVDDQNRLVGVITQEDVLDAVEDILDETIASVAGTSEKVGGDEPSLRRFLARAPWLFFTLCAGLVNVGVMSSFESFEKGMLTFVLFFVPLITGMSGNIGIQCSTVLIRAMALGLVTPGKRRQVIIKELYTGACAGIFFGIFCGLLVHFFDFFGAAALSVSPWSVGLIVGTGLFGACLTGTCLGVFSPFLFSRIGIDPAVAAGPIVTALNDFLSMSIYFLIAVGISALVF